MKLLLKNLTEPILFVASIMKDGKVPILVRVILGLISLIMLIALSPLLFVLGFSIIMILLLLIFLVVFIYLILIFPVFSICSCLLDILIGKKLKNYKETGLCKYHLPLFTYYFSVIPILLGAIFSRDFILTNRYLNNQNIYLLWETGITIIVVLVYLLIFYVGMWRRIGFIDEKNSFFIETLKKHRKFLNLSFIPLSFIVTIIGLITAFSDINIKVFYLANFFDILTKSHSNNFLLNLVILMLLFYILSIPVQLLALFVNYTFQYIVEEGHYYRKVIFKVVSFIDKIVGMLG